MKIFLFSSLLLIVVSIFIQAQPKLDDFGRIVLNTYIPDKLDLPSESKALLETKLSQITSNYGMGGSDINPRFIITASVNVSSKDIIAGPPPMIAQNIDITLFIGDAFENKIFSNLTLSLKGVGNNENKSLIDALKRINPKNKEIESFIEEGKNKIITFYNTQCDFFSKEAETLTKQGKYEEAIYRLSLIPEVCQDCYFKSLDQMTSIYQQKIDSDCNQILNNAKTIWVAQQNSQGAEKVGDILSQVNPAANCHTEVNKFIKSVESKLKADEKARWDFKMKQYEDKIVREKEELRLSEIQAQRDYEMGKENLKYQDKQAERNYVLDKTRVSAYRDIAVEYAKNQPKTIYYNNIYWR